MYVKLYNINCASISIQIPYYKITGYQSGPTIFLAAGINADDINSIDVIRNFIRVLKTSELDQKIRGRLLVFPIIDVINFDYGRTHFLNAQNTKNKKQHLEKAVLSEVLTELSLQFFRKCDVGIIFVDSSSFLHSLPVVRTNSDDDDLKFVKTFGHKYIIKSKKNNLFVDNLFINHGTRVLTVEVGCAGILVMDSVKDLMQNIKIFLAEHEALDADIKKPNNFIILDSKTGIKAKRNGIINLDCNLKQKVQKGDRLGTIYYPTLQTSEIIKADKTGIVFAKRIKNLVQTGQTIVTIV